jgi:hypothetical protein
VVWVLLREWPVLPAFLACLAFLVHLRLHLPAFLANLHLAFLRNLRLAYLGNLRLAYLGNLHLPVDHHREVVVVAMLVIPCDVVVVCIDMVSLARGTVEMDAVRAVVHCRKEHTKATVTAVVGVRELQKNKAVEKHLQTFPHPCCRQRLHPCLFQATFHV